MREEPRYQQETQRYQQEDPGDGRGGPAVGDRTAPAGAWDDPLVGDADGVRRRWDTIKVAFVDDPRRAVADAEALLEEVVEGLLGDFRRDRQQLEAGWDRGEEASTERLRRTLNRYRSLYDRLLEAPEGM